MQVALVSSSGHSMIEHKPHAQVQLDPVTHACTMQQRCSAGMQCNSRASQSCDSKRDLSRRPRRQNYSFHVRCWFRRRARCNTKAFSAKCVGASASTFNMMQVHSRCVASQIFPASRAACHNPKAVLRRSQAFRSQSSSFKTGQPISAGVVCHASRQSRSLSSLVSADIFFTQRTVPDQTGRVAIVTGEP